VRAGGAAAAGALFCWAVCSVTLTALELCQPVHAPAKSGLDVQQRAGDWGNALSSSSSIHLLLACSNSPAFDLLPCLPALLPCPQVRERAAAVGVSVAGENALPCFMPNIIDETALHRIVYNTQVGYHS
jgi:hypothetical protein